MRLKVLTTLFFFAGLGILIGWPALVGKRPEGKLPLAQYAERFVTYGSAAMLCFLGSAVGAVLVARQTRAEFRAKLKENMKGLVEGTLEDHRSASHQARSDEDAK